MGKLENKKVAIMATNGFEESELTEPRRILEKEGAEVFLISSDMNNIKSWKSGNWGEEFEVHGRFDRVLASDYDALLMPGGVMNPDTLRQDRGAIRFVKSFFEEHKPVAAICHAPAILAEADVLHGRRITSFESIRKDMENAGAQWINDEVVVDAGLVTSRSPKDLAAFCSKMVEEFAEGKHQSQTA
jgi:protease I